MTCPGSGSTGRRTVSWLFRNWARTRSFSVPVQLRPTSVAEIVAGVQEVETTGGILKAMGTGWSYTDVAIGPEVTHAMDTSALTRVLTGSDATSSSTVIPFALRDGVRSDAGHLVHIEAGIKIHEINCTLDALGLAMPTMGGSNGQSLAGTLSTATHGSDVDQPPIADAVRAIHLVGPGGLEWWIEPEGDEAITDPDRMATARDAGALCSDIRIEYDTELFNAVLVSVGRMGVIYSVVLEAVDAFRLKETRESSTWETMAPEVRRDVVNATDYVGSRFLEIVLSPYRNDAGAHECVVTRRDVTEDAITPDPPPQPDIFGMLCNISALTPMLVGLSVLIPGLIAVATGAALAGISWMLAIPFVGGLLFAAASTVVVAAATTALVALETALIALITTPGENVASKLANVVNLAVAVGQRQVVPELINAMITFIRSPTDDPVVGQSFRIMTGQEACGATWRDAPDCMRQIDGLEFAVDASPGTETIFNFLDDIFALTEEFFNSNRPPGLGLSLRFGKGTRALIGMQQFERTCSVEFILLRGFNGHDDFMQRIYGLARRHGAIPHWGLIHEIEGTQVSALYGNNHTKWRVALDRLITTGGGRTATFRTAFSIQRDLEPLRGCAMPPGIMRLLERILTGLARSRGLRGVMTKRDGDK